MEGLPSRLPRARSGRGGFAQGDRGSVLFAGEKIQTHRDDDTPSPGEPTFAVINEAYRQLCGFSRLEKENFRELTWKQKLRYLREHYTAEIVMIGITLLALALFVTAAYQLNEWSRNVQEIQQPEVRSPSQPLELPRNESGMASVV